MPVDEERAQWKRNAVRAAEQRDEALDMIEDLRKELRSKVLMIDELRALVGRRPSDDRDEFAEEYAREAKAEKARDERGY